MNQHTLPNAVAAAVTSIKEAVGPRGWLEDAADTLKYRTDWRGRDVGEAVLVARPADTGEVAAVVRICAEAGVAVVPQGGNTGLVLGSIPTGDRPAVVLSLDRMTRIRSVDPDNMALVAEAGCVVKAVQEAASAADRLFPLSLASEGSATIGGTLSTNAGGNQTIRYGNAREQVLGLEVVLPDGSVFDGLNTLRKNNTGYDLKHLFIGAEGTLGVITAAALRLMPAPRARETALLAVPDPAAAQALLGRARELSGDTVLAFELMPRMCLDLAIRHIEGVADPLPAPSPWYALIELATASPIDDLRTKLEAILAEAMEAGRVGDGVIAESETQRAALWRIREEQAEAGRREGGGVSSDVSVPVSRVADFLGRAEALLRGLEPAIRLNTFGHMGDGNIHYLILRPLAMDGGAWKRRSSELVGALNDLVADMGGSFSAEHGIGAQKRQDLVRYAAPSRLTLMRAVKAAIDPRDVMNPGKIL